MHACIYVQTVKNRQRKTQWARAWCQWFYRWLILNPVQSIAAPVIVQGAQSLTTTEDFLFSFNSGRIFRQLHVWHWVNGIIRGCVINSSQLQVIAKTCTWWREWMTSLTQHIIITSTTWLWQLTCEAVVDVLNPVEIKMFSASQYCTNAICTTHPPNYFVDKEWLEDWRIWRQAVIEDLHCQRIIYRATATNNTHTTCTCTYCAHLQTSLACYTLLRIKRIPIAIFKEGDNRQHINYK